MTWHRWNPFLRHPRVSLLAVLGICALLAPRLGRLDLNAELRVLLEGDQRNLASYEKVREILANVEVVVVSLECPEVFSPAGIDAVRRVSATFLGKPGVVDVKSLTHSSKPVRRGFTFDMVPLVSPGAPGAEELAQLKQYALSHPLLRNVMVSGDSRHTLITVTYQKDLASVASQRALRTEVEGALAPFRREGLRFQVLALPLVGEEIRSTIARDLRRFLPVTLVFVVLILWLTFRSWSILALVLGNLLALFIVVPVLMTAMGFPLNVFTLMLFPLIAGIHLAQLAHVFTGYQRARLEQPDNGAAIEAMLQDVFKSCAFSLLTTAIGLLSLATTEVRQIREFGLLGAMAVAVIFLLTFGPGLAFLKLMARPGRATPPHPTGGILASTSSHWASWLGMLTSTHRGVILAIAGLLMVLTWQGVGLVRTDIRAAEFLNRGSPTRQAVEALDRVYGGINVVQVELDSGRDNGANDLAFLRFVDRLQHYAATRSDVSGAYSYAQLLAMMNQIWEGDRPEALRLPENSALTRLFVLALRSYDYPFLAALTDRSFRRAHLVIRTQDMPSDRYLAVIKDIVAFAHRTCPAGVSVSATRGIHTILEADRRILRSQLNSAGLTSLVILLVLTLLWRSAWLALASLLTNALPVGLVMAVAGFAGIPLNSVTIMVAAISLGIVVDDSIHFITHWRDEMHRGIAPREAVLRTLQVKVWPIVWTSVILVGISSVFWFSSFPPVFHFGALSAFAYTAALVSVLVFLPAMLGGNWRATRRTVANPQHRECTPDKQSNLTGANEGNGERG